MDFYFWARNVCWILFVIVQCIFIVTSL